MKRWAFVSLLMMAGCGGQSAPVTTPTTAAAPLTAEVTDPRVGELQVMVHELLDRIEVLNARIQRMEAGAPAASVAREATPNPPVKSSSSTSPGNSPVRATAPPPTSVPQADSISIGSRYQSALTLFGKGRINDARAGFEQVLQADSSGELADNALYWIAETYFVTGKFNEAMTYYKRIEADYSDQNKAPDAMLRMGEAQAKLGDLTLARRTLTALVEKFPYSTAAAAAKAELARIQY